LINKSAGVLAIEIISQNTNTLDSAVTLEFANKEIRASPDGAPLYPGYGLVDILFCLNLCIHFFFNGLFTCLICMQQPLS